LILTSQGRLRKINLVGTKLTFGGRKPVKSIFHTSDQLRLFRHPGNRTILGTRGGQVILPYVLGLDSSTQSLSAVVVDRRDSKVVKTATISYKNDSRLVGHGIDPELLLLPPRRPGEADQPPLLFLASLEALFDDLKAAGVDLGLVGLVNVSAQQHGQVYLSAGFLEALSRLRAGVNTDRPLAQMLSGAFSHGRAPIWKTSDTATESEALRKAAGGSAAMIGLTGSDSPLRFTGAVARKVFHQEPGVWDRTVRLHMLSSFLPAVLTGNPDVPADWGNGSGTSLMDYNKRDWDPTLLAAAAEGLAGGAGALAAKLTPVVSPLTLAGTMAPWFVKKFGFSPDSRVLIGSGDNPQTKVLVEGDLLSLGTSFVMMVDTGAGLVDGRGWGNAMYDGVGRPFLFGCRTNGALVWDRLRQRAGLAPQDFVTSEAALAAHAPGSVMALWQPDVESFPPSPSLPLTIRGDDSFSFAFPGCVDSALGLLYRGSLPWLANKTTPLAVTGGPTASPGILRRIAAIWNRPVVTIGTTGAALGAAAAALAFDGVKAPLLPPSIPVQPLAADVEALHRPGGYLDRLEGFLEETARKQGEKA
jgi:xylulokinase